MSIRIFLFAVMVASSALANADETVAGRISACNKAMAEGDPVKALDYAGQALNLDKKSRDALLCQGRSQSALGKYQEALNALKAAEALSASHSEHMVALTLMGNVHRAAKQSAEALAVYQQALARAQQEQDKQFQRIELNLIGDTQIETGNVQAGLDSYLAGSPLAANDNERGDSYARIAAAYSLLNQHDKAIEFQIKTVLMQQQAGDLDDIASANLELGRIYTAAQEYPNAEKAINKVIKLAKEQGGAYWEAKAYYYLALAKNASQQPQEAKTLLVNARQISEQIGADSLSHEIVRAQQTLPQ